MTELKFPGDALSIVEQDSFRFGDEDDGYLYHVTSEDRAERISAEGFHSKSKMFGQSYHGHSEGRVFFTEKSGVMFWKSRVEDQLFDQYDEPPEVAVLKVPKQLLRAHLLADEPGSNDAKHAAYFARTDIVNSTLTSSVRSSIVNVKIEGLDSSFHQWFEGSKMVGQAGEPRPFFHGTNCSFDEFDANEGWFGHGIYFTDDPAVAAEYADVDDGGNIIPVFLNISNPFLFTEEAVEAAGNVQLMSLIGFNTREIAASLRQDTSAQLITQRLEEMGHDGIIARQSGEPVEYIAFHSDQVKFAAARDWLPAPKEKQQPKPLRR